MEHYGWCVGALWVVCGSIRERNYRLKKKNYLSGPNDHAFSFVRTCVVALTGQGAYQPPPYFPGQPPPQQPVVQQEVRVGA